MAPENDLASAVTESLSKIWAPLYIEPGLAGREFFFADSRELFTAYAYAFPHIKKSDRTLLRKHLGFLFSTRSPFSSNAIASLNEGNRREYFQVPPQALARLGSDKPAHRFGGVYSAWLFAERCDAAPQVLAAWPDFESAFNEFTEQNPNFGRKPELYFNRYFSSLIAFAKIADRANNHEFAAKSRALIRTATPTLVQWWRDAGTTLTNFNGSQQLDPFIGKGDKLSWAVFPHRHKLAIFQDLTPEISAIINTQAPEAAARVWSTFTNLAPTWYLMGEERQYHFGENFEDTPDFALSAFHAYAFLKKPKREDLLNRVDIPFCKADLYHIQKLAIALEVPK
jgi:hypothetical protein